MMKVNTPILLAGFSLTFVACDSNDESPGDKIEIPEGYSLQWSDEFDGPDIDASTWTYETGDGTDYGLPVGWGNNEKQLYTDESENSGIGKDGDASVLMITAMEADQGYTSAKLTTNGLRSIRFGRVDVKAKLPKGQGIWSAIWMLGDNRSQIDWPGCGEIDILESLGHEPDHMYSTLHFTNADHDHEEAQGSHHLSSGDFSEAYHLFSLDWTPDQLVLSIDGIKVNESAIEADMKEFQRSFYLILNVAVGGYWPGDPDNTTQFPQTMYVDYVRVFSKDGLEVPEPPTLDVEEETAGQIIEPNIGDNAIKVGFSDLGNLTVVSYGGGGEPEVSSTETAIDGDLSLVLDFPGGNWGGAYIELATEKNLSAYSFLKFSLNKPEELNDVEIKLESKSTNASVFLKDYESVAIDADFVEYSIPLSDFTGLNISEVTIPFAMWNPTDANGVFVKATVLVDRLYFSE